MAHLLVIGSPSLDVIHIGGETHNTIGGAGMYMSMAAKRSGVDVSIFGPKPKPMQHSYTIFSERLEAWLGPDVSPDAMPRFEISHEGNSADYMIMNIEIEGKIDPSLLPKDLSV